MKRLEPMRSTAVHGVRCGLPGGGGRGSLWKVGRKGLCGDVPFEKKQIKP